MTLKPLLVITTLTLSPAALFAISTQPLLPASSITTPVPAAGATALTPSAFPEGENLLFVVRWGLVKGGYSSLRVQDREKISGQSAYHIVAEAHSTGLVNSLYHVDDRNEAWLETETPSSLRYARQIHEGTYRLDEQVELNQKDHHFHQHSYRIDKKTYEDKEGSIPPNVLDVLGSLYYVRTLPLAVGKTFTIDVHSGDKVYPLTVAVKKRQTIKVRAGKFDCFLVEPQLRAPGIFVSKGKKLEVWMTADERRMPVLLRAEIFIGHVSAELVKQQITPAAERVSLTQRNDTDIADPTLQ